MSQPAQKTDTFSAEAQEQEQTPLFDGAPSSLPDSSNAESNGHAHRAETRSQFWGVPNNVLHDYYDTK